MMPTSSTSRNTSKPRVCQIDHIAAGKVAAIEVKISRDMPLPMPFSVTSSANHMMRPVPAVIVRIMSACAHQASFVSSWLHAATPVVPNSWPERATVTSVVDCSSASAIVR